MIARPFITKVLGIYPAKSLVIDEDKKHIGYVARLKEIDKQLSSLSTAEIEKQFLTLAADKKAKINTKLIELVNAPVYTIEKKIAFKILRAIHTHLSKETIDSHFFDPLFDSIRNESPSLYRKALLTVRKIWPSLSAQSQKKFLREFAMQQERNTYKNAETETNQKLLEKVATAARHSDSSSFSFAIKSALALTFVGALAVKAMLSTSAVSTIAATVAKTPSKS